MVLQLIQESRIGGLLTTDDEHIGIGVMVFHQVGKGQDHAHITCFRLDDVGIVLDHRLAGRHGVDHRNVVGFGIFLHHIKGIAEERSYDQIDVLVLNLSHCTLSGGDIVGHINDGQIQLQAFLFHVFGGNHETFVELEERHGARSL